MEVRARRRGAEFVSWGSLPPPALIQHSDAVLGSGWQFGRGAFAKLAGHFLLERGHRPPSFTAEYGASPSSLSIFLAYTDLLRAVFAHGELLVSHPPTAHRPIPSPTAPQASSYLLYPPDLRTRVQPETHHTYSPNQPPC